MSVKSKVERLEKVMPVVEEPSLADLAYDEYFEAMLAYVYDDGPEPEPLDPDIEDLSPTNRRFLEALEKIYGPGGPGYSNDADA